MTTANGDAGIFFVGFAGVFCGVILGIVLVMAIGVADNIVPKSIEDMNALCASNGGVSVYVVDGDTYKPWCRNGVRIIERIRNHGKS